MAGKSFALVGALAILATGCPSNISQTADSGKDYRVKGAKKIGPDGANRWRSGRDIVTYPGGDRVDWKFLEVPEGAPKGTLNVKIKFDVPRPKLDVAFEVYDPFFHRIARVRPSKGEELGERDMRANTKDVSIDGVGPGKYYVMIYAPRRTDAARYRVSAKFTETKVAVVAVGSTEIPDPPSLPAIPDAPIETPPDTTPPPPQPCPNDPTLMQPNCPVVEATKPVAANIRDYTISAEGGIIIKLNRGQNKGIEKQWKGQIVDSSGKPIPGGDFVVYKATATEAWGKVKLSVDQVKTNKKVIVSPP